MSKTEIQSPQHPLLPPEFFVNRRAFDRENLRPFTGMYIAWNLRYERILGFAATQEELWEQLKAGGIDLGQVYFEFVEDYLQ